MLRVDHEWWSVEVNLRRDLSLQNLLADFTLFTNASVTGWGGCIQEMVILEPWREEERLHISVLEMRAVLCSAVIPRLR